MTLREYLAVPYRIEAETVERAPGVWVRRARYPELAGCAAEAATIEATLELLERRRVEIIVAMLDAGTPPPVPRDALTDCDPDGLLAGLGLVEHLAARSET